MIMHPRRALRKLDADVEPIRPVDEGGRHAEQVSFRAR